MDIEKVTDLQHAATEQQDQEEGRKSGKKGEYAENLIIQKNKSIEQQATQPVPGFSEARGAWEDNHSKTNLGTIQSRVNANAQSFLGQTRRPAPVTSGLQAFPIIGSKNCSLPTDVSTDQGLSEYKAKVARKEEELEAANARFEILEYHFSSLRKELEEYYLQNQVGVFEDIRGRLEDIAASIRSNPVGPEVPNRDCSVTGGNPREIRSKKSVSFINIPQWREYFSTESSPVKAEKRAKLPLFSKLAGYTSFLQFFKRVGGCYAQSSLQSAGSNSETTSPTNPQQPPFEKSDNAHNQQASEDNVATTALRELASTTLYQNNLILSKLGHRQHPASLRSTSSRSHSPSVSPFVPPTKTPTAVNNMPLTLLYTANIFLFLTFLLAIAWALAAGLMADRERRMWLQGGETARMASVLLQPEGGFWEKGWGVGAGGWGVGGDVEGLREEGYF